MKMKRLKGSMTVEMTYIFPLIAMILMTLVSVVVTLSAVTINRIETESGVTPMMNDMISYQEIILGEEYSYSEEKINDNIIRLLNGMSFYEGIQYEGEIYGNYVYTSFEPIEKTQMILNVSDGFVFSEQRFSLGEVNVTPERYRSVISRIFG